MNDTERVADLEAQVLRLVPLARRDPALRGNAMSPEAVEQVRALLPEDMDLLFPSEPQKSP